MIIGPTFFSSPAGDHPAGDGLTRLQTVFAGASSADISSYAIGPGTQSGGTVYDGYYEVNLTNLTPSSLSWTDAGLWAASDNVSHTIEWFMSVIQMAFPSPWRYTIFRTKFGSEGRYYDVYGNATGNKLGLLREGGGVSYDTTGAAWSTNEHHAIVFRPDSTYDMYIAGQRVIAGATYSGGIPQGTTGNVRLGGTGGDDVTPLRVRYHGVRVRRAEMYSGASFAPPISPAVWGPP